MTRPDVREAGPTRVALVASGDDAAIWAHALRGHGGVEVVSVGVATQDEILERISESAIDGVVFAQSAPDLTAALKRAIIARKHVMCAPMVADSHQLLVLEELARSRRRALLFDAGELSDPRIALIRRSTRSEHDLRRIRYVRSTSIDADARGVEDIALRALARLAPLMGLPRALAASATSGDTDGDLAWVTMTAWYEQGGSARIDASTLEPEPLDEMVAVTAARAFVLEAGHLQMVSTARTSRLGGGIREERSRPVARTPEERLSATFLQTVREGAFRSNARDVARAALMWEMARTSLRSNGAQVTLPAIHPLVATPRPNLQVIKGGGHTTDSGSVPMLRVMAGGRLVEQEREPAPPPQSA